MCRHRRQGDSGALESLRGAGHQGADDRDFLPVATASRDLHPMLASSGMRSGFIADP